MTVPSSCATMHQLCNLVGLAYLTCPAAKRWLKPAVKRAFSNPSIINGRQNLYLDNQFNPTLKDELSPYKILKELTDDVTVMISSAITDLC
ncbi:hypothetical protein TNCV_4399241 [Trichonephila clavipes]|nr:hypothetical protein TNCV_4399241 [Trichonephila clavipes]